MHRFLVNVVLVVMVAAGCQSANVNGHETEILAVMDAQVEAPDKSKYQIH